MPEPPDDSSSWRSSASKELETTLSVIRQDMRCEWLAIAKAQLVDGEVRGAWLAHCGQFPRVRPLKVAELLERGPRLVGLEAVDEDLPTLSPAWVLPLPVLEEPTTVRHTTVLVVSTPLSSHLPESIHSLNTMIADLERRYLAEAELIAFARHGQVVQILMTLLSHAARAIPSEDIEHHTIRITSRSLSPIEVARSDEAALRSRRILARSRVGNLGHPLELVQTSPSGTTLAARLPRLLQDEPAPDSRNSHPELLQAPYRILVVDDEPLIARAIKRALGAFVVQVASDGAEALSALEEGSEFDVVLCDLMMPRLSGADLFAIVQERYPHFTQRFVFMTGGAFADWGQHFLETAHRPIIEKPFQPNQLRKCIESVAKKVRRTR